MFTVLAEDAAALIGLVIAAGGILASHYWNMPVLDGLASVLIGEGIRLDTAHGIREIVMRESSIVAVGPLASMYIGPDEVLLAFNVTFAHDVPATEVARAISRVESAIRARYAKIARIYIEAMA